MTGRSPKPFTKVAVVAGGYVAAFLVCALFSPDRFPRVALLTATVMEVAVSAYGGSVWLVPMIFFPR